MDGDGRPDAADNGSPVRVFVSYAHEPANEAHRERVRDFWLFLRASGIDARLDMAGEEERRDWPQWMDRQVREARFVLVVASPEYRRRAEDRAGVGRGRGVRWEALQIRDRFYDDQDVGLRDILPVILPGCSAKDIPSWLAPAAGTYYQVTDFSVAGAETLLRALTGQPSQPLPPLGSVPVLPPRGVDRSPQGRPVLRTAIVIEAGQAAGGHVVSAVWVAGSLAGRVHGPVPGQVDGLWSALRLPPADAGARLSDAGRRLGRALFGEVAGPLVADLLHRLPPGDLAEVVLAADGRLLAST
jgi:hypothetical protein